MANFSVKRWYVAFLFAAVGLLVGLKELPVRAQEKLYNPIPMPSNSEIADTLTDKDIPTGEGGFARDYAVQLEEGDQVAIDLTSDDFDSIIMLLAADGSTVAENDDGPDGSTNSLLFARITEPGNYIVAFVLLERREAGNLS
jgi:Bacterial pre-peptidase C-terminal domain